LQIATLDVAESAECYNECSFDEMAPRETIPWFWFGWVFSWLVAAFWSDRTAARPRFGAEAPYRVVLLFGASMLFARQLGAHFGEPLSFAFPTVFGWGLVAVACLGFAFAWWARVHLGRLWSGHVTKKAGHRVIQTGPYALVRHPIYTGVLVAAFATSLLEQNLVAVGGAVLMTLGFFLKARVEEAFLRSELGASAYDDYRSRVPMLMFRFTPRPRGSTLP
jgi:protein-S-isoprenylcysteine O-methyltransferase Ste14